VHLLERERSAVEAGSRAAALLRQRAVDIAVFHGSAACAPDSIAARLRGATVQVNLVHGVPMHGAPWDGVIYLNEADHRKNGRWFADRGAETACIPIGLDPARLGGQPTPRAQLGIPAAATVLATAGSNLEHSLSEPFMALVAEVLRRYRDVWFLALGPSGAASFAAQRRLLERAGVADRARFPGFVGDVVAALRSADVYLNEFPTGGGVVVLEAMAAGLPVVATSGSEEHVGSYGAALAGEAAATPEAYRARVERLVEDPALRRDAGRAMAARFAEHFDASRNVRRYEDWLIALHRRRTQTPDRTGALGPGARPHA
jgi:hypothetical protein